MDELNQFAANVADLYNAGSDKLDLPTARKIVKEINTFLFTCPSNIGSVYELGQKIPLFFCISQILAFASQRYPQLANIR